MPNYTPEQLATRYRNAALKLGSITDTLEALTDRNQFDEGTATYAGSALYYINHVCDGLERKAVEFRAGHTATLKNELRGSHVIYRCICGFEADNNHLLLEQHIKENLG